MGGGERDVCGVKAAGKANSKGDWRSVSQFGVVVIAT